MSGNGPLGHHRLQPGLYQGRPVLRQLRPILSERHAVPEGRREADRISSRTDNSRIGVHDVPDDVCDHHSGAHRRRVCRPHEIFGDALVHGAVVAVCLFADRAHDVGALRILGQRRGAGARLCGRHGGAHQRRHCGPCLCAGPGQASRLRQGSDGAAQPDSDLDRRLVAVGGLVRLQRRFRCRG